MLLYCGKVMGVKSISVQWRHVREGNHLRSTPLCSARRVLSGTESAASRSALRPRYFDQLSGELD